MSCASGRIRNAVQMISAGRISKNENLALLMGLHRNDYELDAGAMLCPGAIISGVLAHFFEITIGEALLDSFHLGVVKRCCALVFALR